MNLHELPINDMMAQCSRKLIVQTPEEEQARINEIENCNHLFVKLRDFDLSLYDNLDLSIIECVHCGVTNKYQNLERVLQKYRKSLDIYMLSKLHYTSVDYKETTIETEMMNKIKDNGKKINMMSNEIIRSLHPGVLYQIAIMIKPNGSNEELFEIMQRLNELETSEEKNKLNSIEDATDLINRYKEDIKILKK